MALMDGAGPITHTDFTRYFRALAESLSTHELDFLVQYPDEVHNLFATSKFLGSLERPLVEWKDSPAVKAYIFYLKAGLNNFKKAGHSLHTVTLDKEPGHSHFFYQLAADLRDSEADSEAVSLSERLIKEFLRVQRRGTSLHFLGMVELASTLTLGFLHRDGRLASFAVALELFREAVKARFAEPWPIVAKRVIVFGRILHNRYRYFAESDENLEKTMEILDVLWDIIPVGRPFRASVLEIIVISALLYLSRGIDTDSWLKTLKHLTLAVELHLQGSLEEGIGLDNEDTADIAEILLQRGLDPAGGFTLASQAICLVHIADMIRATAWDACSKPGFFKLSASLYKRSIGLLPETDEAYERERPAVASAWAIEKAGLRHAILTLGRGDHSNFTLEPSLESTAIFSYRAVTNTLSAYRPKSYSHSCLLHYYVTWVSYLPKQESETDAISDNSITVYSASPWPDDFMSLPGSTEVSSQDRPILPSVILPGIEKVITDEAHEIFKMPLELRTIRAFMGSIDSEVRVLEKTTSYISENVIRWSSEPTYWNPRDVRLSNRMAQLKSQGPYFSRLAQLQALLSRGPERCLELVESSRTLFWNRLLRLQTSFAGLPEDLASSLEATAHELDKCRSQFVQDVTTEEEKWQWELESVFNSLLSRARSVPGFENLLMPKSYEALLHASSGGPVVVLMGNNSTYAALVVRPSGVDTVFLPDLTDQVIGKLIVELNRDSRYARSAVVKDQTRNAGVDDERYLGSRKSPLHLFEIYLDKLWKFIVKPVFEFMGILTEPKVLEERPRLWWCPTGKFAFLPIHAAGNNFGKGNVESVSKYVVSSYTPTLSALLTAREKTRNSPSSLVSDLNALVLAQPNTPGHAGLPMTLKEISLVAELIPSNLLLHVGEGPLSKANVNKKVEEVMKYLEGASILHLACHGHQDRQDPLNSGFELSDGRLSLSKLISGRNPKAFLAFLSACESAANDVDVPDESLNLAAAMLFAGFRSVIGTMWTMNDNDGPQVAQMIYEELFNNMDSVLDPNVIPYALDAAVRKFQENGIHPSRWATYIHVGM
ncbi:CHAT domain-containing protein [Gymnopilus junonius]|uniref:CHAT domain-containing protein n=1 Tax=Gymnopilus junonius TaxID=109634 RepID=A0A9P5NQU6_GYMJU|nr:CHAT domain-containing protein [Gymnopilus junonius]